MITQGEMMSYRGWDTNFVKACANTYIFEYSRLADIVIIIIIINNPMPGQY